jgi:hypothetical protein
MWYDLADRDGGYRLIHPPEAVADTRIEVGGGIVERAASARWRCR